jgi:hypothetical protein
MLKRRADGKRVLAGVLCGLCLMGLVGCGGGDEPGPTTASTSPPLGRAPSATAPPGAGGPATSAPVGPTETPAAGGSQRVRVPATFTLRGGALTPREVSIPAFLAVQVSVAAADGRSHTVTIAAERSYRLVVPAGKRASILLPGQAPGRYAVRSGGARAVLAVGGEPGP